MLIGELQRLADTPGGKTLVMMPPGSAKSTYCSVLFPAWWLARGRTNLIAASHTQRLAETFSRRVHGLVRDHGAALGYQLATEAGDQWRTTAHGEYLARGIGAPVAGFRADAVLIDDPVKSAEAADSEVQRDAVWAWYTTDLRSRLKPDGRTLLVMTRWHEDDLAGRLLLHEAADWRVVKLPALAEADDPLGRVPGAPLWSDDVYGYGAMLRNVRDKMQAEGSARAWSALYQQQPRPVEGSLFKVAAIPTLDAAPAGGRSVRYWDLAATADTGAHDPDWTAGVKLTRHDDGRFVVSDVRRLRGPPETVEAAIVNTATQDGRSCRIGLPQDPGQAGKSQIAYLTRKLTGYTVTSSRETGDKATRAGPVASQANVGNVSMVRASWNAALIEELRDFPTGRHDDQVDALSGAFAMLINAGAYNLSAMT